MEAENVSSEMDITALSINPKGLTEEDPPAKPFPNIHLAPENKPEVKRRVKALQKIQVEVAKIEAQFYEEMHALETKCLSRYNPCFEKRKNIVLGTYEPNSEECGDIGESESEVEKNDEDGTNVDPVDSDSDNATTEKVSGIPGFWLTIFQNVEVLNEILESQDEVILKHLTDITVEMKEKPMEFTLSFHFSPNEYFTNSILTKTYEMSCEVDENDPFRFDGPEIIKCKGCPIDWLEGKNVTVRAVKKKQKHKASDLYRIVNKTISVPSFFNFFDPPQESALDEESQMSLMNDFEIGQYIREKIVPRAVLYYTGEAFEDGESSEEEEEAEEEESEDGSDSEARGRGMAIKSRRTRIAGNTNPECKQQ